MYWLFNLLYWSTLGTKGTRCYVAGNKKAQAIPFHAVSALSSVPRNTHRDLTSLGSDSAAGRCKDTGGRLVRMGAEKAPFPCLIKEISITEAGARVVIDCVS